MFRLTNPRKRDIRWAVIVILGLTSVFAFPRIGSSEEVEELSKQFVLLHEQGNYLDAVRIGERILAINEKTFGPESSNTAISINNLGLLYEKMGDTAKAESSYLRALNIREKTLGAEHPITAIALSKLAGLYKLQADYAQAVPLYQKVLVIRENSLGPEHPQTANVLYYLADLHLEMGNYDHADTLIKRSLSIREKVLGPEHPDTAASLNTMALLYEKRGDYNRAKSLYRRSRAIFEKTYGRKSSSTATIISNEAILYLAIGDYDRAEQLMKRVLAIKERSLGPEHPDIALSLNNLAILYGDMGDHDKAGPLYQRALVIDEKNLGPEDPAVASDLDNIANFFMAIGDYDRAEPLATRSLSIREKVLGPEHPSTAGSLNTMALIYNNIGDYNRAEPLLERALTILEKTLGPGHPNTAYAFNNLASLKGYLGRDKEALQLFKMAQAVEERVIQNVFSLVSDRQKLVFVKRHAGGYEASLSLIHQRFKDDQDALRTGLDLILSRKGIVFDAQSRQREAIATALDPKTKELWERLSSKHAALAKLLQTGPGKTSSEIYLARISSFQAEIQGLESELSSKSALVASELEQRRATAEKVARRLPKGSVLAEFVKIKDYDWDEGKQAKTSSYLAFILHPDGRIELVNLGDAKSLESVIQTSLAHLKIISTNLETMRRQQSVASRLHTLLWEPLEHAVGNATFAIISPDGILNLVPFAAIRDADGSFLAEKLTVTYLTSGRDLLREDSGIEPKIDLFLAADPEYSLFARVEQLDQEVSTRRARSSGFSMSFRPLPGTALEAKIIPGLIPGKEKRVLTKEGATESAVIAAKRPKIIHLATHGFFLEDQPELSFKDDRGYSDRPSAFPRGYENPLVRSGLAFASANHAMKAKTSNDGLLTALEVSGMDLYGTDLVTLSACETGVGELMTGEGVFGLRRAFALSGARNLLMTLWPVSDNVTAEQMNIFYRMYGRGTAPAQSLRAAQLETIKTLRERFGTAPPSLWAPFILQGSPNLHSDYRQEF